jgi:hypothetical protein
MENSDLTFLTSSGGGGHWSWRGSGGGGGDHMAWPETASSGGGVKEDSPSPSWHDG